MPNRYQYPFDLRQLASFAEVGRRLHFRQAAEALALAQPALSRQIRNLEKALGCRLLNRSSRRVELTPAGRLVLDESGPLLEALLRLPERAREAAEGRAGVLRMQFTGLAMATVLPALLRRFAARNPQVRIELTESPTSTQLPALVERRIDLGFVHPDQLPPGLETRQLLRERNGVVLPRRHPLSKRQKLHLSELRDTPVVLFPRGHNPPFYDRILAAFSEAGVAPRIADEVWPRSNAVGLVRAGLGTTLMCPSEAGQLPEDVVFRPLRGPAPESRLALAWASPASPVILSFLAVLEPASSNAKHRLGKPHGETAT